MKHLGKHIGLKLGVPIEDGPIAKAEEEHTVENAMAFVSLFAGL
jgi:hypothetical protein